MNPYEIKLIFHNDYKTDLWGKSKLNNDCMSSSHAHLKNEASTPRNGVLYMDEMACPCDFAGGACKA
jgi:hypothetical protein